MKKFFRLVSVFAIAGVTFAYTSCTDYSEDIEQTNGRVTTLEGSVATLQNQVTSLQSAVSSLQSAMTTAQANITDLQTALGKLQDKHDKDIAALETAYKNADAALKTELEGKITALQTKHQQDVTAINQEISALKTLTTTLGNRITALETWKTNLETNVLPTFATKTELQQAKEWVEATFATKEALGKALEAIGALDGRLTIVETKLAKLLDETVPDIYSKIEAAHNAAKAAQATASEALGKVDTLIEALGVYAEKGKLEETIAELVKTDSTLNAEILKLIEQDEKFKVDIKNLQDKDAYFDRVVDTLKAQDLIFDAAIIALQKKDKELDQVDAKHDSLITRLDEIKLNISDFQTYFDNALTEAVKDNGIVGKVINAKVNALKEELTKKINDLEKKVMDEIAKINGIFPERLTSIVFVPQYYVDGIDAIVFETLAFNGMKTGAANENTTATEDQSGLVSKYKFNVAATTTAKYRFSPKTVGLDCADFDFVGNVAETRVVAPEAPIQKVGAPKYDEKTGEVVFTVEKKENVKFQEGNKIDIVALKATLKKGLTDAEKVAEEKPVVFSEYERVVEDVIYAKDLAISDSTALVTKSAKYPTVAHADWKALKIHEFTKTFNDAADGPVVYKMNYNEDFDLGELVATCVNKKGVHSQLDLAKFGLYYKFSVAESKYEITTANTTTNQQTNIKCVDEVNGIYRTTGKYIDGSETEYNKESIGRKPIVKIELMHGNEVVTRAFVKLEIVVVHQNDILVVDDAENYVYGSNGCGKDHELVIDVETMRAMVYRVCNISHEEFWNTYEIESSVVTKNGAACTVTPPTLRDGTTTAGVATKEIVWKFNDDEVGVIGKGAKLLAVLTLRNKLANSSTYPEHVKFQFEFNYTLPDYTSDAFVNVVKKDIFWKNDILQANVNRPLSTTDVAANCWFNTPIQIQPWDKFEIDAKGKLCIAKKEFKIVEVYEDGVKVKKADLPTCGVSLSTLNGEVSIALDKSSARVKKALNSENGLQADVAYVVTLQSGDVLTLYTFRVNFIRPLTLNMPEGLSVTDAEDGGDKIDFDFTGLLVDWRGALVLPPYWSTEQEVFSGYYWNKVCSPADHALVVPGYQRIKTPAKWVIEFEDVTIPIQAGETFTLYTATIEYKYSPEIAAWYQQWGAVDHIYHTTNNVIPRIYSTASEEPTYGYTDSYGNWHDLGWTRLNRPTSYDTFSVKGEGRSEGEARQNATAALHEIGAYFENSIYVETDGCERVLTTVTSEVINTATEVTFKNMKSATYTPEEYEDVPAEVVYSKCNKKPSYAGDYEGQKVGCYQWTKWEDIITWVQLNPGQYWDFYGPISSSVVLDLAYDVVTIDGVDVKVYKNVTTDLPDGKLPAGTSLRQDGNVLYYENVLSPIQYPYHIYIPAKVTYGWGELTSTMTVTVNPVATIAQ